MAFAPGPVSCSWRSPAGTLASANRPLASTVAVTAVPTTATADGSAPCTAPVIVAEPAGAAGPEGVAWPVGFAVDGAVGASPLPPQAAVRALIARMIPRTLRMDPPAPPDRKASARCETMHREKE